MNGSPRIAVSLCFLLLIQCVAFAADALKKVSPNARRIQMTYAEQQLQRLAAGKYAELEAEMATPSLADAEAIGYTPTRIFFSSFRVEDWQKVPDWDAIFKSFDSWE